MKNIIYLIAIALLISSCEKVIDVDLNSADPQIVIEGTISDQPGPYTIKISKTTDYFNPEENPTVSYAVVNITDSEGNFETLLETEPGVYKTTTTQGVVGRTYELYVNIDGEEYKATSYLPPVTSIDSLSYEKIEIGMSPEERYAVRSYFTDTKNIDNYYRLKYYINSELSDDFYVTNDQVLDGKDIEYGAMLEDIELNDVITVELMNIDEDVYDYYNTLSTILNDGGMSSATPSNPNSNISNGALGYFGAYSSVTDTITIN